MVRLKYGTSSAETTTLCFWIKSPKTGTHWVRLYGDELTNNAFISRKYTVSSDLQVFLHIQLADLIMTILQV